MRLLAFAAVPLVLLLLASPSSACVGNADSNPCWNDRDPVGEPVAVCPDTHETGSSLCARVTVAGEPEENSTASEKTFVASCVDFPDWGDPYASVRLVHEGETVYCHSA